jgi:hypothetical protein
MSAFLGMRGNGDWVTDQRPKDWREGMLYLYPNGDMPLNAILSKMGSEKVTDPEFNWWTKGLPVQGGTAANVFLNALLTSAYVTGGVAGDVVYAQCTAAVASEFRVGHQVLLRNTSNYLDDTNAKVVAVIQNGASSYVACKLLQADPTTTGIADVNRILVIGNINSEGGAMPDAIAYDPTKYSSYTQIFRTPLSITRTARLTKLRTGDQYKEAKREALQLHGIEMEKAFLWGYGYETTGSNGKPERSTWGIIPFILANGGITSDFSSDAGYTDTAWLTSGEEWLDEHLEELFRYGSGERLAVCGSGTILGINKLVKTLGNFQLVAKTMSYGIQVLEWVTPFGVIYLKRHPLFSYETTNRNSMLCMDASNLKYRYVTDTTFYDDPDKKNTGRNRVDGTDEEFLTEAGLEIHHPSTFAFLNGFNTDNGTP